MAIFVRCVPWSMALFATSVLLVAGSPSAEPPRYVEYEAPAEMAPAYGAAYHSDPTINSRRTEHFLFRWGPEPKDGLITEQVVQGHLQMLEHVFDTWTGLGLRGIGGRDPARQYKAVIMPGNTWKWDGPTGAVGFGEGPGVAGLHVPTNCLAYQRGNGCTPHEVGHGWQNQGGLPPCQPPGWTESLANWVMSLHLATYPNQWPAVGITANHACQCYNHYSVFNHFLDRPGYGTPFINRLIFDPNLNSPQDREADDLFRKAIRVDTSGSKDPAGTVRDELGRMNARMLDMDFWNRRMDRQYAHKKDAGREFFFFNRIKLVRQPGVPGNWYRPEWTCTAQVGSNNYIPLAITAQGERRTVHCDFRPVSDAMRGSWFRACFVAFNRSDEPRYGRLWNAGYNSFTLADDEEDVYLASYAMPKACNWSFRNNDYTRDNVAMFPYRVRFAGAEPKEFREPVPTRGAHRHPNGGGLVADSAKVDASAWVGPEAMVLGSAKVHGKARIEDCAVVEGNAVIGRPGEGDDPVVSGYADVTGEARVFGHGKAREHAWISGKAEIFENGSALAHTMLDGGKLHGNATLAQCPLRDRGLAFRGDYSGCAIRGGDQSGAGSYDKMVWVEFPDEEEPDRRKLKVDNAWQCLGYSFEKRSSIFAMDEYGMFHGYLVNEPQVVMDQIGQTPTHVLALDGSSQYVELPPHALDRPEVTIALWVKWTGNTSDQRIFSFGDGQEKAMWLTPMSKATGKMRFAISDGRKTEILDAFAALKAGTWTHVAVTLGGNKASLYVNGTRVGQTTASLKPDQLHAPMLADANFLGRGNTGDFFSGRIDEFRIFMRPLSDAEVIAGRDRILQGKSAAADAAPPTPGPGWLVAPSIAPKPLTGSAITMTAIEGADPNGVLYYFHCLEDPRHDSGWISEAKYIDCRGRPGQKVTFTVKMKDQLGNSTGESAPASVTLPASDTAPPQPTRAAFATAPKGASDTSIVMTAIPGTDADELVLYRFSRVGSKVTSGWTSSPTWTDRGLQPGESCSYTVQMQDGRGNLGQVSAAAGAVARDETPPALDALRRLQWDAEPIVLLDASIRMSAQKPGEKDIDYYFQCVEKPEVNSGWMRSDTWLSPPMPDGDWTFRFKLRDRSPQRNESAWSIASRGRVLPTNCYHNHRLAESAQLPDSSLVRFRGTVTEVKPYHYAVSDGGASIIVVPRSFGWRTEPSYQGRAVTVEGHLWTCGRGPKTVTYARVAPAALTGRIECENGRFINGASPVYHPSASFQEAVGLEFGNDDAVPNGVEFSGVAATKQITLVYALPCDAALDCCINGRKAPDLKLPATGGWDHYGSASVPVDIPEGAALRLMKKAGQVGPNLDCLVIGGTHLISGTVAGVVKPTPRSVVRVCLSSAADPVAQPEYVTTADEKGAYRVRLMPGKWFAAAVTEDEVGARCQASAPREVTVSGGRGDIGFRVEWLPGRKGRIEAESGRPLNGGGIATYHEASGGMMVAYIDGVGRGVEFTNVGPGKNLYIRYASPGSGTYGLYVNGKRISGVRFEPSGGWDKCKTVRIAAKIPDHATLKFQRDPGDGAWNLDYIEIE